MNNWIWILIAVAVALVLKHMLMGGASKEDIKAQLDNGAVVIDVRTPTEFRRGHYKDAINIPVGELSSNLNKLRHDKTKPIVLYCHSGARAASAKHALRQAGFTNVINAGSLHHMPQ
jgi:phage shock protein E